MANKFWVGGDGNWSDAANHWATSSNGTPGAGNAPTTADTCIFDGNAGAGTGENSGALVTVDADIDIDKITLSGGTGDFSGTLDTNDHAVTCTSFSFSGAGTRRLDLGASVITCDGASGTPWDLTTTTGLTFVCGTSWIKINGSPTTTRTFSGGAQTYNKLTCQNTNAAKPQLSFIFSTSNISNTFATLEFVGPLAVALPNNSTQTCTTFTALGTAYNKLVQISGSSTLGQATIAATTVSGNWCVLQNIVATGTGTFLNSFDGGNNTATILGPQPYHVI